jgi:predicted nucleotidyltransferase component of viral defense system
MIADNEIEQKAAEFCISPINVEKDYVYGWLLKAIYDRPQLAARLVLKGGQALRKARAACVISKNDVRRATDRACLCERALVAGASPPVTAC